MVSIVVGLQWGDEGKGKVSSELGNNAKIVIRATGGNNAGHTVVCNGQKYALHLLPSAIMKDGVLNIIGPGVVVDLDVLIQEIKSIFARKPSAKRLMISDKAHIIFAYHKSMDKLQEELKEHKIGTTGRGIGPCYSDKMSRVGIRMGDLITCTEQELRAKIREAIAIPNILFQNTGHADWVVNENTIYKSCCKWKKYFQRYIVDVQPTISKAINDNTSIVIEGAQAFNLDIDHGDYPFVTSSNPIASGACSGAGIGPMQINNVIGILKAYSSRVGEGPFPTELSCEEGEEGAFIREMGNEYGTTTGRPRRCGWLDLAKVSKAAQINGCSSLCINHIDTVGIIGLKLGHIAVCIGYDENQKPIYEYFGGWKIDSNCKTWKDLPSNAQKYLGFIEEKTHVPVQYIGIGSDDADVIKKW